MTPTITAFERSTNAQTWRGYAARGEARPAYKRAFDAQLAVNTGKPPTR